MLNLKPLFWVSTFFAVIITSIHPANADPAPISAIQMARNYEAEKNYTQAVTWYFKEAVLDNTEAQLRLASLYTQGQGVVQDYNKAAKWLKIAAAKNNPEAQYQLAQLFLSGYGVNKDKKQGFEWLLKSSMQNHSKSQLDLAGFYMSGDMVKQDQEVARSLYYDSCINGNTLGCRAFQSLVMPKPTVNP